MKNMWKFNVKKIVSLAICLFMIVGCCMPMYADNINNTTSSTSSDFNIDSEGHLIKYLGDSATVNIPKGTVSIANEAFRGCKTVVSIIIPTGVNSVGDLAFYDCPKLKTIQFPKSVTAIGNDILPRPTNTVILCEKGSYAEHYCALKDYPCKNIFLYVDNTPPKISIKIFYKTIKVKNKNKKVIIKVVAKITDAHLDVKNVYFNGHWMPWGYYKGVFTKKGKYTIEGIDEKKNKSRKSFVIG